MLMVITRPSVFLIGKMDVHREGMDAFLAHLGVPEWATDRDGAEEIVEVAGRSCYNSFHSRRPGGNREYIRHILEVGHGSVAEHAVYVVAICGISRILSQEITRHRHHSPSQLSQRFVDESESAFVLPAIIDLMPDHAIAEDSKFVHTSTLEDNKAVMTWMEACENSLFLYRRMVKDLEHKVDGSEESRTLKRKRVREAARGVLLNDIETRLVLTGNARAWRWFLELRGTAECALEMRRLAVAIYRAIQPEAPNIFQDSEVFVDTDGRESLRFLHHKV
jgi:thymidylate synthase (FAD)